VNSSRLRSLVSNPGIDMENIVYAFNVLNIEILIQVSTPVAFLKIESCWLRNL